MTLAAHWEATWSDLGLARPDASVFAELLARHSEPTRAYHTCQHLEECFAQFARARSLADRPGEVQLALWFHDAIYDTRSSRNEDESADWADAVLESAGAAPEMRERIRALILATRHAGDPGSADARLTVDIDLSILGAPAERFAQYEAQVRQEYAWVPDPVYRAARARILAGFLERPAIFATQDFRSRLEAQARRNLRDSLARPS
jgi:predicted metal-dependent HD superfamily phosphohydrolase